MRFEKDGEVRLSTAHTLPRKQSVTRCVMPATSWSGSGLSMTNTMTYKGYAARIEYDDEDGIFTGRIAGIRDGVGFHANIVEGHA